ncbi:hypothetical protein [Lentzea flaviverrucosa]|uniref:hypothetical protein n=1 Tax=Lentzea flaviverrucosa TaxID=200379 RepID=UPI001160190A|nr:hypothetical protein [Lentzea flaviverrucosa]
MDSVSLHTMARRYLMSRIEKLPSGHGGTSAALTIQKAVDRLDRDDLPPPRTLAAALATAASAPLDRWPSDSGERDAISAERERFRESVRNWVDRDLVVEPLPYRRVFGEDEAASWARRIEERWAAGGRCGTRRSTATCRRACWCCRPPRCGTTAPASSRCAGHCGRGALIAWSRSGNPAQRAP